ncbi:endonuclease [Sodaliphilus sp.]|uniref:endonuclease n=1 Tax=Sodaliphilus sp. TaxID=2815818 RepID=UPI00388EB913
MQRNNCILITILMLACGFAAQAAIPSGYYSSLNGKSGRALKDAVHDLAMHHTVLSYNSLWTYFPSTDCMPDNKSRVWDMYSDKAYYFNSKPGWSTSGMNREHSLPKSWWGGDVIPAYTDINHLFPSDDDANMEKSNHPLGEVSTAQFDNGVTKVGPPKAGQGGGASRVFEPDDRYKGDFARTYFYMAACYQDLKWKYTYMLNNATWLTLNQWSIDLLLKWHRNDPVSDKEKNRNDAVYRAQANRNPFIDNPNLVEYIWGDKQGQVFTEGGEVTGDPELLTPAQGTQLNFGEVALGKSLTLTLYVKGANLTNKLSVDIYRDDASMFKSSVSSVDRVAACSADGYPLAVTYTPTSLGDHKTRLVISDGGLTGSVGAELTAQCLPVPTLSGVRALPATDITDSTFVANWEPLGTEDIDYYVITHNIYTKQGGVLDSEEILTDDAEQTSYEFTNRKDGYSHTYTVHSYRLGYTSAESNVITIDAAGISGVQADKPVAFIATEGGVLVKCSESIADVNVYTITGSIAMHFDRLDNDTFIYLPMGVYVVTSAQSTRATKLVVR